LTLTANDRENRRLLQLINGGTTKYMPDDALKVMELDSDFALYSCAAWRSDKIAALIADQFIIPRENAPNVCATNGRPLVFMLDDCRIVGIDQADRMLTVDCPVAPDFCRYIERTVSVIYLGAPVVNSVIRGNNILIQYRDGAYPTKWVVNNGAGDQVVPIPNPPIQARVIKLMIRFHDSQYWLVAQSVHF
jgi:hypothetical protein